MKKIIHIALFLLFGVASAYSQKIVEKTTKLSDGEQVSLEFKFADEISVSTWDRNEVYVKVNVNINNNEDNDSFRLNSSTFSRGIEIESEIENMEDLHKTSIIRKSKNKDGKTETITTNSIDMELFFEVKLPRNAKLSINTINGNITIEGLRDEMEIKTISGFIDLSLPSKHQADLVLNTITGKMYTDFDLNLKNSDGLHQYIKSKFSKDLNGGGEEISLKTISGDIFLRKEK
ncbi:hypothetical protein GCQ56_08750 [Marinifilum sp. N1E240]|uniref:hypothetical protein n=1 Tax=Marinifilum sp. N1E240 TaxID=2608082 RepID=UPI00128CDEA1|nr:hypothetical protein [Marinifilum sp. N1E240]MPQ47104.1 hypothetical protein [Marinifilum sp. N1E240]